MTGGEGVCWSEENGGGAISMMDGQFPGGQVICGRGWQSAESLHGDEVELSGHRETSEGTCVD